MARPTKQGIDYFPLDVEFDDKVELFVAECEAAGLGILVTIWQQIYKNEGYFIKNDENLILLVRRRTMAEVGVIKDVIRSTLERKIFDPYKEKKYGILTSRAILKRYLAAARKKKQVIVVENYSYSCVLGDGNHSCKVVLERGNATKEEVKEEEEVKEKEDICSEPQKDDSKPKVVLTIPLIPRDGEHEITEKDVSEYQETFPGVDILTELKKCRLWNKNKPSRRKTKRGIRTHIANWLGKAQDGSKGNYRNNGTGSPQSMSPEQKLKSCKYNHDPGGCRNIQKNGEEFCGTCNAYLPHPTKA